MSHSWFEWVRTHKPDAPHIAAALIARTLACHDLFTQPAVRLLSLVCVCSWASVVGSEFFVRQRGVQEKTQAREEGGEGKRGRVGMMRDTIGEMMEDRCFG